MARLELIWRADLLELDEMTDRESFFLCVDPVTREVEKVRVEDVIIPVGTVQAFGRRTAPDGWLELAGQEYEISDYPKLVDEAPDFAIDQGNGKFKLLDLRGEFLRGAGGVGSDRRVGTKQEDAFQRWETAGLAYVVSYNATPVKNQFYGGGGNGKTFQQANASGYNVCALYIKPGHNDASVRVADETRPRNVAVMWCIKY